LHAYNFSVFEGKKEADTTNEAFSCQLEAWVEQAAMFLSGFLKFFSAEFGCWQFASGFEWEDAMAEGLAKGNKS
jgi:hypothetical protein